MCRLINGQSAEIMKINFFCTKDISHSRMKDDAFIMRQMKEKKGKINDETKKREKIGLIDW
jgi:hypothetical protein